MNVRVYGAPDVHAKPDPSQRANWARNREIFKKDTVYFDFDSSTIKGTEKKKVSAVADYLKSNPGNGLEVWGRLFRPDGQPAGPKKILNTYTQSDQHDPTVAAGANGTFVVVWQSDGQDGDFQGVFGQVVAVPPAP